MKGMPLPLPFDFHGKGVFDLDLDLELILDNTGAISSGFLDKNYFFGGEPTSVLDSAKISSSTLSSSLGVGGGSTDTAGVAAVSDTNPSPGWQQESATATSSNAGGADSELLPVPPSLEIGSAGAGAAEKLAMEDWEGVLSDSLAVSPTQEQSIIRWIMGDVEDPSMGNLNKALQIGAVSGGATVSEFDFGAGFGVVDPLGFGGDQFGAAPANPIFPNCNRSSAEKTETKPPIFNPQAMINQHHTPPLFFPMSFAPHQDQNLLFLPPAKRHNPGTGGDISGHQEFLIGRQQLHPQQQPLPHYLQQRPKIGLGDELGHGHQLQQQQQQQAIVDQLYKAAELVQTGNPVIAQGILARLNHQLCPIGKPFNRAAFYCKEALELLLHMNNTTNLSTASLSPISLIFKIGAYKSFSEISPLVHFANFTCNQALLEVLEGFDKIHIVDFDIGYGGQWASLMQELAMRSGGAPALKITVLVAPSTHDQLELGLARENLIQFATEINIPFQFEVMNVDMLSSGSWSLPFHLSEREAIAVNLPIGCLAKYQLSLPLVLSFVKQLSPRIVVSVDGGCDRTDLPFANHIIHTLQTYANLLESLDAGNVNTDAMQKIERLLLQPGIEKIVLGRFRSPEKAQPWRAMFLSSGFSPLTFSNFSESQAECVVKRTPIRGFQVEKRHSSLVLCWQRKELISASAWRC